MTGRLVDGTQYNLGYDEENHLVTLSGGSLEARYVYDGDGKRVLAVVGDTRTLFVSSAFEVSIEGTPPTFTDPPLENYPLCHYLYCFFMPLLMGGTDNEVLGMQSGNFGNTRYHTHPIEPTATNVTWRVYYPGGGLRVQTSSSNTLTYLLTDHLNSTSTTLDTDDDVTAWLRYDAWGVTRSSSGITPTDKRYTGQYQAEAGLYFYNARWYDPETGRFAQADTIIPEAGDPLAWDRYAYVNNNPLIYSDPSGHNGVLIAGALGGALGGVIYGYGSQVINNLNQGMSFGQALTTNISGSSIALYTVVGGLMGTVVAPLIAPVASSIVSIITPASSTIPISNSGIHETGQCGKIVESVKQSNINLARFLGNLGENLSGVTKNSKRIESLSGTAKYRIPDGLDVINNILFEVKNVQKQGYTSQIKDYLMWSFDKGYKFILITRQDTILSKPLQNVIDDGYIILQRLFE